MIDFHCFPYTSLHIIHIISLKQENKSEITHPIHHQKDNCRVSHFCMYDGGFLKQINCRPKGMMVLSQTLKL